MKKLETSPNPNWKPGDSVSTPFDQWTRVIPSSLETIDLYKLLIGIVVPRPIAFVSTMSKDGQPNLAPFSFFNGVSTSPLTCSISVTCRRDGSPKDTAQNILETGEFVINSVNRWMVEAAHYCSAEFPHGVNEFEKAGLTGLPSESIKPHRVKESAVQLECKLYNSMQVGQGKGSSTLIVGEVVQAHIAQKIFKEGKIDPEGYEPIARMAGAGYTLLGDSFDLPRVTLK